MITVKDLKEMLKVWPDDAVLVGIDDDCKCSYIDHIAYVHWPLIVGNDISECIRNPDNDKLETAWGYLMIGRVEERSC